MPNGLSGHVASFPVTVHDMVDAKFSIAYWLHSRARWFKLKMKEIASFLELSTMQSTKWTLQCEACIIGLTARQPLLMNSLQSTRLFCMLPSCAPQ